VLENLGSPNPSVRVGPGVGFDAAVVSLNHGKVLLLTSDPLSIIPDLGMEESAWLSLHLLASDFTTTGRKPEFAVFDFNVPNELTTTQLRAFFRALGDECRRMDIAIVAGHTGSYPGAGFTVVGGGVLLGVCEEGKYFTPAMAKEGDVLLVTKGAAIETTAILARAFPRTIRDRCGAKTLNLASAYLKRCSTVEDAMTAVSVGGRDGVTSMHDATEGGVLGGIYELSLASGRKVTVDPAQIYVSPETTRVCELFSLDPMTTLSEGTLLITCGPRSVEGVKRSLQRVGIPSFEVGHVGAQPAGLWLGAEKQRPRRFYPLPRDPYWAAYTRAQKSGWS